MAGLRGLNVNGLGELYSNRERKDLSPRLQRVERSSLGFRALGAAPSLDEDEPSDAERNLLRQSSSDAASRQHLEVLLEDLGSEQMAAITAPDRPEVVPDLTTRNVGIAPDLNANSVTYQQSAGGIPVFGARVVVDVDRDEKTLVAVNGQLAPPPQAAPLAELSPADAWGRLLAWAGAPDPAPALATAPVLTWYVDDAGGEFLTYRFRETTLQPRREPDEGEDDGFKAMPCVRHGRRSDLRAYDYFVDAKDGSVRYYFRSSPQFIPAPMRGQDYSDSVRDFYGFNTGGAYVLRDPLRNIETFDYNFSDIDAVPMPPMPASAMSFPTHDIGTASPAAVAAHWHATLVFDFFNDVLKRNGIDDKGMKLVSVVNVYSSYQNDLEPPQWPNASWWRNTMWYGQETGGNGQLVSFARHLDVIAHELTHGVTSTSSGLVYRDLSGALNESFSDIFGIFVANWFPQRPNPVQGWTWEIGAGLGDNGGPLRNFATPAAAGQPDHMSQYVRLPEHRDSGGVHLYSGIHNRAVHGLLTALDANGDPIIPTAEAALLLYLTLLRLTQTSDFSAARRTLTTVAGVYYANHPSRDARLQAIAAAYDAAGIA